MSDLSGPLKGLIFEIKVGHFSLRKRKSRALTDRPSQSSLGLIPSKGEGLRTFRPGKDLVRICGGPPAEEGIVVRRIFMTTSSLEEVDLRPSSLMFRAHRPRRTPSPPILRLSIRSLAAIGYRTCLIKADLRPCWKIPGKRKLMLTMVLHNHASHRLF